MNNCMNATLQVKLKYCMQCVCEGDVNDVTYRLCGGGDVP